MKTVERIKKKRGLSINLLMEFKKKKQKTQISSTSMKLSSFFVLLLDFQGSKLLQRKMGFK